MSAIRQISTSEGQTAHLMLLNTILVSCQPYDINRRNDDLRMFGWHFVAAVDHDLPAGPRDEPTPAVGRVNFCPSPCL
jgi:hypothetical protein